MSNMTVRKKMCSQRCKKWEEENNYGEDLLWQPSVSSSPHSARRYHVLYTASFLLIIDLTMTLVFLHIRLEKCMFRELPESKKFIII